jgi:two-component system, LuxR family, response regulator FixJ
MTNAYPVVHIVDDDAAVRDSLDLLLRLRGYRTRSFASGEALLASVGPAAHGCIVLDLCMPGANGLAVQSTLRQLRIDMPVIVLTAHGDAASARAALKAGAFDFLEKPVDDAVLISTIEAAHGSDLEARTNAVRRTEIERRVARLTPREREVLVHVVSGRHNREIAELLHISPRTVEVYKAKLLDKLQVDRLPELIRLALDAGILSDDAP